MSKHYSQKDNLITIMTEIAKKTPKGIMNGDTTVGHITWQMYLMRDYLKLDGTPLADASTDYADLLSFAQDNNLITNDTTDNSLFKYDSTTDVLTLPNYIDLVLQGGNSVEEKEAGLPNIRGTRLFAFEHNTDAITGAFTKELVSAQNKFPTLGNNNDWSYIQVGFNASNSNPIYSDSISTVQPPSIVLIPQIKYRKATTMYEQIDAVVNYSTTEKVIGTWIDGKPLYQITYTGTLSNNNYTDFATHNVNIKMIKADGYIYGPEGGASPIAIGGMLNSNYYCGVFSDYQLYYSDPYKNGTYNITLQYTKITD